jgi:hypothetical protein
MAEQKVTISSVVDAVACCANCKKYNQFTRRFIYTDGNAIYIYNEYHSTLNKYNLQHELISSKVLDSIPDTYAIKLALYNDVVSVYSRGILYRGFNSLPPNLYIITENNEIFNLGVGNYYDNVKQWTNPVVFVKSDIEYKLSTKVEYWHKNEQYLFTSDAENNLVTVSVYDLSLDTSIINKPLVSFKTTLCIKTCENYIIAYHAGVYVYVLTSDITVIDLEKKTIVYQFEGAGIGVNDIAIKPNGDILTV